MTHRGPIADLSVRRGVSYAPLLAQQERAQTRRHRRLRAEQLSRRPSQPARKDTTVAHLLHLDASARIHNSTSRALTALFAAHWRAAHPDGVVSYRDVGSDPPPHMSDALVGAMFVPLALRTSEQIAVTAYQERLIHELELADTIVLGVPMYNFGVPSALKAWIDHVVVFGRTVDKGLFDGARVVIITARGGAYGPGTPREACDFQEPYLRTILGLVGLTDITFIHAEMRAAVEGNPELAPFTQFAADSLAAAQAAIVAAATRPHTRLQSIAIGEPVATLEGARG
jgi:FMN-dependent NADH-azoreductase